MECIITDDLSEIDFRSQVYIYGTGAVAKNLYEFIIRYRPDLKIIGFIDSFIRDGEILSMPIIHISSLSIRRRSKIIVASSFQGEILASLKCVFEGEVYVYDWNNGSNPYDQTGPNDLAIAKQIFSRLNSRSLDKVDLLQSLPLTIEQNCYLVINYGFGVLRQNKNLNNLLSQWNHSSEFGKTSVEDFTGLNAFSGYSSLKFDKVLIVDAGEDLSPYEYRARSKHLLRLIDYVVVKLGKPVSFYKLPTSWRICSILDESKVVFISQCKNGSSSMRRMLDLIRGEVGTLGTYTYNDIAASSLHDYTKFTFVRNPYDRVASLYAHTNRVSNEQMLNPVYKKELNIKSFEEFCKFIARCPDIFSDLHFQSQTSVLRIAGCEESDVLKFKTEEYDATVIEFFNKKGIPYKGKVLHSNKSKSDPVNYIKDWYTPELIDLINLRYEEDFINFGYEML